MTDQPQPQNGEPPTAGAQLLGADAIQHQALQMINLLCGVCGRPNLKEMGIPSHGNVPSVNFNEALEYVVMKHRVDPQAGAVSDIKRIVVCGREDCQGAEALEEQAVCRRPVRAAEPLPKSGLLEEEEPDG